MKNQQCLSAKDQLEQNRQLVVAVVEEQHLQHLPALLQGSHRLRGEEEQFLAGDHRGESHPDQWANQQDQSVDHQERGQDRHQERDHQERGQERDHQERGHQVLVLHLDLDLDLERERERERDRDRERQVS